MSWRAAYCALFSMSAGPKAFWFGMPALFMMASTSSTVRSAQNFVMAASMRWPRGRDLSEPVMPSGKSGSVPSPGVGRPTSG